MSSFAEEGYEQDETARTIEEHGISGEDIAAMESMEKDMETANIDPSPQSSPSAAKKLAPSGSYLPAGAMPTTTNGQLSTVANEFWFPESRNCPCCKGFKHGCRCRIGNITTCKDSGCTTTAAPVEEVKVVETKPRHKPVIVFKNNNAAPAPAATSSSTAAPTPAPVVAATQRPAVIDTSAGGNTICTFFNSPQGCRWGAQCRFKHGEGTTPVAGGYSPASSPQSGNICKFFQMGQCRNGAQCRFSHGV